MIMDTGASVSIVMDCNKINSVIQIPEEVLTTINGNTSLRQDVRQVQNSQERAF